MEMRMKRKKQRKVSPKEGEQIESDEGQKNLFTRSRRRYKISLNRQRERVSE